MDREYATVAEAPVSHLHGAPGRGPPPLGRLVGKIEAANPAADPAIEAAWQPIDRTIVAAPRPVAHDVAEGRQLREFCVRHVVQARHGGVLVDPAAIGFVEQHAVTQVVEYRLQDLACEGRLLLAALELGNVHDGGDGAAACSAARVAAQPQVGAAAIFRRSAGTMKFGRRLDEGLFLAHGPEAGLVGDGANRLGKSHAWRGRLRQVLEARAESLVAHHQLVFLVPQRHRHRQAFQRIGERVARGTDFGFGHGVAAGEILEGNGERYLFALGTCLRTVLQQQRHEIEHRADRDRLREPILGTCHAGGEQQEGEAGEGKITALLVEAAGSQGGADQQAGGDQQTRFDRRQTGQQRAAAAISDAGEGCAADIDSSPAFERAGIRIGRIGPRHRGETDHRNDVQTERQRDHPPRRHAPVCQCEDQPQGEREKPQHRIRRHQPVGQHAIDPRGVWLWHAQGVDGGGSQGHVAMVHPACFPLVTRRTRNVSLVTRTASRAHRT